MKLQRDLSFYLWTLKSLGLLYDERSSFTRRYCSVIAIGCLQTLSLSMFIYCFSQPNAFHLNVHNQTGNIYLTLDFGLSCLVLSTVSGYFYVRRAAHAQIVQQVLKYNSKYLKNQRHRYFTRLYLLYVFQVFMGFFNFGNAFFHAAIPGTALASFVLIFTLNFAVCGLIMLFYACVAHIVDGTLAYYNLQLAEALSGRLAIMPCSIAEILRQRQSLMTLCRTQLNSIYGIALLPIIGYVLFESPAAPFFLITIVMEIKFNNSMDMVRSSVTTLLWDAPWLIVFIAMMTSNNIDKEARKITNILSKAPRTDLVINKMIDKFLLKNLRPTPILTAYGFFSLNKDTLFKLFTAIFTYMVILVQFKEMEIDMHRRNASSVT